MADPLPGDVLRLLQESEERQRVHNDAALLTTGGLGVVVAGVPMAPQIGHVAGGAVAPAAGAAGAQVVARPVAGPPFANWTINVFENMTVVANGAAQTQPIDLGCGNTALFTCVVVASTGAVGLNGTVRGTDDGENWSDLTTFGVTGVGLVTVGPITALAFRQIHVDFADSAAATQIVSEGKCEVTGVARAGSAAPLAARATTVDRRAIAGRPVSSVPTLGGRIPSSASPPQASPAFLEDAVSNPFANSLWLSPVLHDPITRPPREDTRGLSERGRDASPWEFAGGEGPITLLWEFLKGTGPEWRVFRVNDWYTSVMRDHPFVKSVVSAIREEVKILGSGPTAVLAPCPKWYCDTRTYQPPSEQFASDVFNFVMQILLMRAVGPQLIHSPANSDPDLARRILGGFTMECCAEIHCATGEVTLYFRIYNAMTVESLTRDPRTRQAMIRNELIQGGNLSPIYQVFWWKEKLPRSPR